jgi:hypothetical protein
MVLYLTEENNQSCNNFENSELTSELLIGFFEKYNCLGLNCSTEEGEMVKGILKVESLPHLAILVFTRSSNPECLGA